MGRPTEHDWLFLFPKRDAVMRRLIRDGLFYAPWIGDTPTEIRTNTDGTKTKEIVKTTGQIVERVEGFVQAGTDSSVIPIRLPLMDKPLYGNAYYPGTGEKLRFKWRKAFVNQIGKVVEQDTGKLEKLRTGQLLKLYESAEPELVEFMRTWLNAEFISAFYDGHSMNITEGLDTSPEGIGANRVFHPNMYVNNIDPTTGAGDIDAVGTEKRNKTTAEIISSNMVAGAPQQPSDRFLDAMTVTLSELKIQKAAKHQGVKYWLVPIDRRAFNRFKQNTTLRGDWLRAFTATEYANPLFGHDVWIYGEFMFAVDNLHARAWDNVSRDFAGQNGYTEAPTMRGSQSHRVLPVLGETALGWADAVPYETRAQQDNFGLFKELLTLMICGVSRSEYVHEDNYAQYFGSSNNQKTTLDTSIDVVNQGSALFAVGI